MAIRTEVSNGVAEVVIDNPPVNALGSAHWRQFADELTRLGADDEVRCIVIRAEGRGFQAGVDVKELAEDGSKIVDVNRGCYDTFAAIYDCRVPVISAVHGYCLGGGIGISGSSDIVIASEDATFGLPEIDRGALGAATHLMRLVGMQKTRTMLYTGESITAQEAYRLGALESVVPREQLRETALELANKIASKSPRAMKLAKWSLNGIELLDPKQSYRFEQGFTLELYQSPDSLESRTAFVEKRDAAFDGAKKGDGKG
ncbi:MAG: enoyl-CoA hydratase family protein [Myxococcota bacterium]